MCWPASQMCCLHALAHHLSRSLSLALFRLSRSLSSLSLWSFHSARCGRSRTVLTGTRLSVSVASATEGSHSAGKRLAQRRQRRCTIRARKRRFQIVSRMLTQQMHSHTADSLISQHPPPLSTTVMALCCDFFSLVTRVVASIPLKLITE